MEAKLQKIYSSPNEVGSFGGVEQLFLRARELGLKVSRKQVRDFLKSVDAYTLHKPARKRFVRNKILVGGIDQQWQADLADMQELRKFNDGYGYILTVIDCFSKFAWAVPIKTKSAKDMVQAFTDLLDQHRKPQRLQTDKGKEFLNESVQHLLKQRKINFFTSNSDQKAAIVERFNRTLKTRIWRYFTAKETRRYTDVLQQIINSYNKTKHRTIGVAPSEVNQNNEQEVWRRMYRHHYENEKHKSSLKAETSVRLSKAKTIFEKGYLPNWTEEKFKVAKASNKGRTVYKVKDEMDEAIEGQFYPEEIQEIDTSQQVQKIEKVLKKRKTPKGIELLVKWRCYQSKFNSWILQNDVQQLD